MPYMEQFSQHRTKLRDIKELLESDYSSGKLSKKERSISLGNITHQNSLVSNQGTLDGE